MGYSRHQLMADEELRCNEEVMRKHTTSGVTSSDSSVSVLIDSAAVACGIACYAPIVAASYATVNMWLVQLVAFPQPTAGLVSYYGIMMN
jgi:hypothetical protein